MISWDFMKHSRKDTYVNLTFLTPCVTLLVFKKAQDHLQFLQSKNKTLTFSLELASEYPTDQRGKCACQYFMSP